MSEISCHFQTRWGTACCYVFASVRTAVFALGEGSLSLFSGLSLEVTQVTVRHTRNSVSLLCLCLCLVTVHLKECLERHCFHKDLAGFPVQSSTILKGSESQLFPFTSTRKSKQSCFHKKSSSSFYS